MARFEINEQKKYRFVDGIKIIPFRDDILVISPHTANWIVLKSRKQLDVFNDFVYGKSIAEVLESHRYNSGDVSYVVAQIEARKFTTKKIRRITDEKQSLHLYLTNLCNLHCPHCYMFSGKAEKEELTTEEIIKLLYDYRTIANGTQLTLSGGEPSMRSDFEKIVKESAKMGFNIKVLTNGSLMTKERVDKIAPYVSSVQISIDGYSESSDATIRGKGHFGKAVNAVDLFVEYGVETSVAITPSWELLQNGMEEYKIFARELIAKYNDKAFNVQFAEGLTAGRQINPTKEFNERYEARIKELQAAVYNENYDLVSFIEGMSTGAILDNCMFGSLAISSVGDVYFCPEIGSVLPVDNIRYSSFAEIYKKAIDAKKNTCISNLRPCKDCELMYICGGGCRIKEFPALIKRKTFDKIDFSQIPPRNCSMAIKERFYEMMVESNEYLYMTL